MSTFMEEEWAGLLRLAIEAYSAKIAELRKQREQLVLLIERPPMESIALAPAPKKRPGLSTEARAKIRAAQIARWEKVRTEKAAKQTQKAAAKKEQQKPEPPKATPEPVKAKASPAEKPPARTSPDKTVLARTPPAKASPAKTYSDGKVKLVKNNIAKDALAPQKEESIEPQTLQPDLSTPAGIVEHMAQAGARFRITRGGSLIVGNLGSLPPAVQRMFLEHPDPHLLTAAARRHLAAEGQLSKQ
jgi:hypothetical protein